MGFFTNRHQFFDMFLLRHFDAPKHARSAERLHSQSISLAASSPVGRFTVRSGVAALLGNTCDCAERPSGAKIGAC